jgi:hypothetical protein
LGVSIPVASVAVFVWLMWFIFHRSIRMRLIEKPYVVLVSARVPKSWLASWEARCLACGWRGREKWPWKYGVEEGSHGWTIKEAETHKCPTLDQASKPKKWEIV